MGHPVDTHIDAVVRRECGTEAIDTADVPPALRTAVWERYVQTKLLGLRAGSLDARGVVGTIRSTDLNGVAVTEIEGNRHTVERTPPLTTRPVCSVMLTFNLFGDSFYYNGATPVSLRASEVAIYDADQPFMLGFSDAMHVVAVSLPRYHLAEAGLEASFRDLTVVRLGEDSGTARAAGRLLDVFRAAFQPVQGSLRDDLADDLVAAAVEGMIDLTGAHRPTADTHYARATAFIDANLADPGLSVAQVAQALNLSQRHLGRVFAARGSSMAEHIQQARLIRAAELLAGAEGERLGIAEIGRCAGFVSASHFSRAYRARYGITPSQARGRWPTR